ncbi:MAG: hypothetical protein WHS44_01490 [Fimbriimonadales bacterium]|nr:MAG: hypothetical protein KatS3mg018_0649 [Fimbriimonadales bacterium]
MRRTLLPIAALYAAACMTANAQVLYSTGFEEFNLGAILNQFGWEHELSSSGGRGDGSIVDSLARSGSKSLKITPVAGTTTGSNWWWKFIPHDTDASPNKIIRIKWDMYLTASSLQGIYGIDVYNGAGALARVCTVRVLDDNTVQLIRFAGGATQEVFTTEVEASRDAWNRFRLDIDYTTRTFKVYLNGVDVAPTETNQIQTAAGNVFGDADIYFVNLGGDSNDSGNYDNYYVAAIRAVVEGDVNGDGCVDDADLLAVLFSFGSDDIANDVNDDGVVDDADLLAVLFSFGNGC